MIEKFSSKSLEQTVLFSMIEELSLFHPVREILKIEHFFDESHKSIYRGIRDLDDRSEHITLETLSNWVIMNDNNASQALAMLCTVSAIPTIATIVQSIIEFANQRHLYLMCQQVQVALESRKGSFNAIKMLEEGIMAVDVASGTKAKSYYELVEYYETQPPLDIMKSHTFLDQMLGRGGIGLGGLILVMGSPEAGKTVFGVQILEYIATVAPVLFFAFEFTVREYAGLTGEKNRDIYKDYKTLSKHKEAIDVEVFGDTKEIATKGASENMYIIDDGYDISDIERELKIWHKKGVRIALIDSQMRVENANGNFNTIESMESDKFSRLAKICHRYEMTIFFICQQGKEDTKTGQHTPMNSKKGAHEAHAIIYIDRDKPKYDDAGVDENRFKRYIEVSKNKFTGKHTKREHYLRPSDLTLHKKNDTESNHAEVEYQIETPQKPKVVKDDNYVLPIFDMPDAT